MKNQIKLIISTEVESKRGDDSSVIIDISSGGGAYSAERDEFNRCRFINSRTIDDELEILISVKPHRELLPRAHDFDELCFGCERLDEVFRREDREE